MGSRIMHLITADLVLNEVEVVNQYDFLLGATLPDAVSPKDRTHFFTYNPFGETIGVDLVSFLERYDQELCIHKDSLLIGYLCHLITDRIWLEEFYLAWIKEKISEDSSFVDAYHRDFRRLNGHLLNDHGNDDLKKNLYSGQYKDFIREITDKNVTCFLHSMEQDFQISDERLKESLEVFTFDQITEYLHTSKSETIHIIKSLSLQRKGADYCGRS